MNTTNKEPVVSIKMTLSELQLLNKIVDAHICDLDEMYKDTGEGEQTSPAKLTLQKQLLKIEEWIDDQIQEAVNDKRISEEGSEKQTKMETKQRICTPCED